MQIIRFWNGGWFVFWTIYWWRSSCHRVHGTSAFLLYAFFMLPLRFSLSRVARPLLGLIRSRNSLDSHSYALRCNHSAYVPHEVVSHALASVIPHSVLDINVMSHHFFLTLFFFIVSLNSYPSLFFSFDFSL